MYTKNDKQRRHDVKWAHNYFRNFEYNAVREFI
jgi:hypothetical protein